MFALKRMRERLLRIGTQEITKHAAFRPGQGLQGRPNHSLGAYSQIRLSSSVYFFSSGLLDGKSP